MLLIIVIFSHLKVGRIHPQLEGMQLAEVAHTTDKIINAFDGLPHASHDDCAMFLHLRGLRVQFLAPVGKVGLGLRVGNQHPE